MTEVERFWSKVEKTDGCWLWRACLVFGYGQFALTGGHRVKAHRYAYELLVGPIPDGLTIDHLCRNTACVNPAHLEPVTMRENLLRGTSPAALNARKTHCKRGHEFTPENTRPERKGRGCHICRREYERQRNATRYKAARAAPTTLASTPKGPRPHMRGKRACDE